MISKEAIEGLLYITNNRELTTKCLRASHILNDSDRNWTPVQHSEFYWLPSFLYCTYLIIIDKQVHVYLIGDRVKGQTYNILNVEGNFCEHLALSKGEFVKFLKQRSKETDKLYLPEQFGQRIIYLKPDYVNNICQPYIFNRQTFNSNMFRKSMWTLGADIYDVTQKEFESRAEDILREVLKEIE